MRRYLIVGQAGVGKSSFINAVFGRDVAKSDPFEPCTRDVEYYPQKTSLGDFDLIDTPGLSENTNGSAIIYLDLVRKAMAEQPINVMLYVSRLDYSRFNEDEQKALQLITQHLGSLVWRRSWLILTRAASVPEERFEETANCRIEQISTFLQELTGSYGVKDHRFTHFAKILLTDNLYPSWNVYPLPTTTVHDFAWKRLSPRTIELVWQGGG